eukprot:CAMPEP_0198312112 /NCGR_PEP_ID=MMETSP1450-20131203/3613_1 /TAXON_ID=753684 ORGANISM="Madagascaria erythrocladiodes, Strain CCMP3234" /NCGR_SAMPLE_ID=MMETSP1450 /ASSEMBLY_ACC=CAM_ASM_001115 /LENGTH=361 /DNA_ID=CAMNT_0044015047 /DNA_START=14 /DNA_END=1100 /DNA_ORIENTATION=-
MAQCLRGMERMCDLPRGVLNKTKLPGSWLWSVGTRRSAILLAESFARSYTVSITLRIANDLVPGGYVDGPTVDSLLSVPNKEEQEYILGTDFRLLSPGHDVFGLREYVRLTGVKYPLVFARDEVTTNNEVGLIGRWALNRRKGYLIRLTQFVDGWHISVVKFNARRAGTVFAALALRNAIISIDAFTIPCGFCGWRQDDECACPSEMTTRWMNLSDNKASLAFYSISHMLHSESNLDMSPSMDLLAYSKNVRTGEYAMRHPFDFGVAYDIDPKSTALCDFRSRVSGYITGVNIANRLIAETKRLPPLGPDASGRPAYEENRDVKAIVVPVALCHFNSSSSLKLTSEALTAKFGRSSAKYAI